jgi:hypothetical protein
MHLKPAKVNPKKIEQVTMGFKGLNRLPVTDDGELIAMTNMSSKYAPALCPRGPREIIRALASGTALFAANGKLCWVDGTGFYYDGVLKGTVTVGQKSIAEYFGTILIFPDKAYYNYVTNTFGAIPNCPYDIKFVCVHNNRAFGCGGNGFYASKLGDPLTWNDLPDPITVGCSWITNTGEEGDFTGIIATQNAVYATKPGYLYKLYNDRPANFLLKAVQTSGCIDGRSLADVNGILFMLGDDGIKIYTGGTDAISLKLNEKYVSGSAVSDGHRYYISMYNGADYNLYVYDTKNGLWSREDNLKVDEFVKQGSTIYALSNNQIIRFNSGTEIPEWSSDKEFTENYLGKKVNSSIKVSAELEAGSAFSIYYSLDGGPFTLAEAYDYFTGYRAVEVNITPDRCDRFTLRLTGKGYVKLFNLSREMELGSTVMPNRGDIMRWDAMDALVWDEADELAWNKVNKYEL